MNQHRDPGDEQMSLEQLSPCPTCKGTGRYATDREHRRCPVCQGTGHVNYNPDDHTEIPYG